MEEKHVDGVPKTPLPPKRRYATIAFDPESSLGQSYQTSPKKRKVEDYPAREMEVCSMGPMYVLNVRQTYATSRQTSR